MNIEELPIAIMGRNIPVSHELMPIDKLHFLPENPRVLAAIRDMSDFDDLTSEEKQVRIYERLLQEQSVKNLIPEIKRDGGLQDPIIVRHDTMQVIEGNSRLAVYRKLNEEDANSDQWARISCAVVTTLTDDEQTRLLGQAHLHGKTDWPPYAKALFCFRWVEEEKKDTSDLAKVAGISKKEINKNVKIVKLMQENNDKKQSNFSYYNVLVENRAISSEIRKNKPLKDMLLSQIKTESFSAQDMRDRLPTVIKKPKILRKLVKGDVNLEDAYERARVSGVEQKLKKICDLLRDIERDEISYLERNELNAVKQVIRSISQEQKRLSDMVTARLNK